MSDKICIGELEKALARPDADQMCRHLDVYAEHHENGSNECAGKSADAFDEIITCYHDDPEKALAYVILGASRSDHPQFLGSLGCGPLESILEHPSTELLERIVAEARKSARFRWLLSHPFKVAIAPRAWEAIERFRITGPHEEPPYDKLPPRN